MKGLQPVVSHNASMVAMLTVAVMEHNSNAGQQHRFRLVCAAC
jgi:hypothetical protein